MSSQPLAWLQSLVSFSVICFLVFELQTTKGKCVVIHWCYFDNIPSQASPKKIGTKSHIAKSSQIEVRFPSTSVKMAERITALFNTQYTVNRCLNLMHALCYKHEIRLQCLWSYAWVCLHTNTDSTLYKWVFVFTACLSRQILPPE